MVDIDGRRWEYARDTSRREQMRVDMLVLMYEKMRKRRWLESESREVASKILCSTSEDPVFDCDRTEEFCKSSVEKMSSSTSSSVAGPSGGESGISIKSSDGGAMKRFAAITGEYPICTASLCEFPAD